MNKIKISNGRIIDPQNQIDRVGTLYISEGKIAALFEEPDGFNADLDMDAQQQIVCPGFIDLSARLREPGHSNKATIAGETQVAAKSGITSICMPPDTQPVADTTAVVELIREKAERAGYMNVFPIGALTRKLAGTELSSMYALTQAGCIAVSNAALPVANLLVLRRAMEYAASHDILLIYRPQDYWLSNQGCAHEGKVATRYGLPGIPEAAESIALSQCLMLMEKIGCRVHFAQLSSASAIPLMQQAQRKSLAVSCDVAAHQLHLTEDDILPFDSAYHVMPPLRSKVDRQALRAGLRSSVINAVCSDHQPHDVDTKLGAFPQTESGISAFETLLPLMLKMVHEGGIELQQAIAAITSQPAKILQLPLGHLSVGAAADVCVFDPEKCWEINTQNWSSSGKNTPYWGQTMQGQVMWTLQTGQVLFSNNAPKAYYHPA